MSEEEFINTGQAFISGKLKKIDSTTGDVPYNTKLNQLSSVFVEACTILANSIPYIGDYDDLNHDRRPIGASFNASKYHMSTEACDDPFAKRSDDCEGDTNAIIRNYRGFRDIQNISKDNKLLMVGQSIAKNYMCFGVLATVNARNIKESGENTDNQQEEFPKLGTPEENNSGNGAHMFSMFIPMRHSLKMLQRTWKTPQIGKKSESVEEDIKWTDGTTYLDYPIWNERLPVLVGEGTGMLNPKLAPPSCYHQGEENKIKTINEQAREKDAFIRVMTGKKIRTLKKDGGVSELDREDEDMDLFEHFDMKKNQEMVQNIQ